MFRQCRVEYRGEKAPSCSRVRCLSEVLTLSSGVVSVGLDQRSVRVLSGAIPLSGMR